MLPGKVIGHALPDTGAGVPRLSSDIDAKVPRGLQVHLVLGDCPHHDHRRRNWLKQRNPFHLHFTTTSSSSLNQVERSFPT